MSRPERTGGGAAISRAAIVEPGSASRWPERPGREAAKSGMG